MEKFERLFEPGNIGRVQIKNRYVMPAMVTHFAMFNGEVSERQIHYYAERARGGVGLIIVEFTKAEYTLEHWDPHSTLRMDTMKHLTTFDELVEAIHLNGAKAAVQITPGAGSWVTPKELWIPGFQSIGPMTFAFPGSVAHALTTDEVGQLVEAYGTAALRARLVGFDAIEMHGHSSYVLGQFMSPYVNKRTDKYGELWRLPVELLQSAKAKAGEDFPVIFRLSGDEFVKGGRTIEGSKELCKRMEEAGADAIDVSGGTYYTPEGSCVFPYMARPRGIFIPQAEEIKKVVRIPVILPGKLDNPYDAEKALKAGQADFIAVGRGLIADPELPRKVAEGRVEDIRPCIYCNECVGIGIEAGRGLGCTVNPQAGKEREYVIQKAANPKKVLVIGGGPGGMEAARVAALRGHEVTLYEKENRLGGRLIEASMPEHKKDLRNPIKWFSLQVQKAGVKIVLGKEVGPELVSEMKPDVAIVATGAEPLLPEILGAKKPIAVTAIDILLDKAAAGDKVVVAGGGAVGCDVAAFLADKGKKVTIVEMLSDLALDVGEGGERRDQLQLVVRQKGIRYFTDTTVDEITDEGVIVKDKGGESRTIKADTVVLALGFKPRTAIYEAIKDRVPEVYAIGDCLEPRKMWDATHEGFFRAIQI